MVRRRKTCQEIGTLTKGYYSSIGVFQRITSQTITIRPKINLEHSKVERKIDPKTGDLILKATPMDNYGNYLGPGYGEFVMENIAKGKDMTVTDHLDGSYTLRCPLKSPLKDTPKKRFRISIFNRTLFKEKVEVLLKQLEDGDVSQNKK
ncbi:MAG: hypothetical protein PF447_14230 [Spirochaetaceae bacterium]|jgi:hypothetical protein|nr:hypothetical protein [Spirochaetaceae bacterium]